MRSFQVMRCGRRTTPTKHELAQTMGHSFSLTSISKRRTSLSLLPDEENRDVPSSNDKKKLFRQRKYESMDSPTINKRNTILPNSHVSSRRSSFPQQDPIESPKLQQTHLRNFSIFFILLFLFLFLSLVYSFIRMIKNPD